MMKLSPKIRDRDVSFTKEKERATDVRFGESFSKLSSFLIPTLGSLVRVGLEKRNKGSSQISSQREVARRE